MTRAKKIRALRQEAYIQDLQNKFDKIKACTQPQEIKEIMQYISFYGCRLASDYDYNDEYQLKFTDYKILIFIEFLTDTTYRIGIDSYSMFDKVSKCDVLMYCEIGVTLKNKTAKSRVYKTLTNALIDGTELNNSLHRYKTYTSYDRKTNKRNRARVN